MTITDQLAEALRKLCTILPPDFQPTDEAEAQIVCAASDALDAYDAAKSSPAAPLVEHFPGGDIGVGTYAHTVEFARDNMPAGDPDQPSANNLCVAVAERYEVSTQTAWSWLLDAFATQQPPTPEVQECAPMTDDLIRRLREQAGEIASSGHAGWGNTMTDAADEIERLREAVSRANERASQADFALHHCNASAQRAEAGRDALKARIDEAPRARMYYDRDLGETVADLPRTLAGKRVALVVMEE